MSAQKPGRPDRHDARRAQPDGRALPGRSGRSDGPRPPAGRDEPSLLRGGLVGMALVAAATVALAGVAALIAVVVVALY